MSTWLKKQCYFNMFIVPIHNFWLPGYDSEEGWSDPYDLNLDPSLQYGCSYTMLSWTHTLYNEY